MAVAVDFETYYDKVYSLTTLGVDAYCADQRFNPYLVSIYGETKTGKKISFAGKLQAAPWSELTGEDLLAHNARFDETVFLRAQEMGLIPADCKPASWTCTADLAVYFDAPRDLAGASLQLLQREMSKDLRKQMSGLTLEAAKAKGLGDKLLEYVLFDAQSCHAIYEKYGSKWPEIERKISRKNLEWGRKGVHIDVAKLDACVDQLHHIRFNAEKQIPWEWEPTRTPLSANAMRDECRKAGIPAPTSFSQTDEECAEWEDQWADRFAWIKAVRDWRRSNMLLKKLVTLQKRIRPDGTFPYSMFYFGAATGRFSGSGGFNMQNLPRDPLFGVDLRGLIVAPPDRELLIIDLAQIEARLTLWLAGDTATLDLIRGGLSLYEADAVKAGHWDPAAGRLKDKNDALYRMYKAKRLGGGYGCGHNKFVLVAKILAGLDLTKEQAFYAVNSFREENPGIVNLWNKFNQNLHWSRNDTYEIELPSWRSLKYYNVTTGQDGVTAQVTLGGKHNKFFGGKILENVIQAIARDLFVENMLRLEEAGHEILFHVHDEAVLSIPKGSDIKDIEEKFTHVPAWLEGCPVAAESFRSDRYVG